MEAIWQSVRTHADARVEASRRNLSEARRAADATIRARVDGAERDVLAAVSIDASTGFLSIFTAGGGAPLQADLSRAMRMRLVDLADTPTTLGTTGQLLATDGASRLSWANPVLVQGAGGALQISDGSGGLKASTTLRPLLDLFRDRLRVRERKQSRRRA